MEQHNAELIDLNKIRKYVLEWEAEQKKQKKLSNRIKRFFRERRKNK